MKEIHVDLGKRSYSVFIERGLINDAPRMLASYAKKPNKVCVVSDENVYALYGDVFCNALRKAGFDADSVDIFVIKAGEQSKSFDVLRELCAFLLEHDYDRASMLAALGGGVVGDLTGFAAAIYKRGIRFIQVPTTVIAQTDSSVGGKTAVDLCDLKNVIGAFHQPDAVYIDPDTLRTLPRRVLCDGLGEVVKYAVLTGGKLYDMVSSMKSPDDFIDDDGSMIAACVDYKREIVEEDEFDTGRRMLLNLGHTLGHAIEGYYGFNEYTHGEAVALGLAEILRYSYMTNACDAATVKDIINVLQRLELPTEIQGDRTEVYKRISNDKKCDGANIRIVLPHRIGDTEILSVNREHFTQKIISMEVDV